MKKTIAILGDSGEFSPVLVKVLMKQDLRLLFLSEDEAKNEKVKKQLDPVPTVAEIEFVNCEREGSWEADMIIVTQPETISFALTEKIKEVATQKIVLAVSEDKKKSEKPLGKNTEAREDVLNIFGNVDYQLINYKV